MADIIHGLPLADYLKIDAVSATDLKRLKISALKYRYEKDHPSPPSPSMNLGSATHCAILEKERFGAECIAYPKTRRGGEWEEFKYENAGKTILTANDHASCLDMCTAVHGHPTASKLLVSGKPEVSIFWTDADFGVDCKARIDWWDDKIVDLKTGKDPTPRGFGRQCAYLGYHIQFAWYQSGVFAVTGRTQNVWTIAVESAPPHDVCAYRVGEHVLDQGREEYKDMLIRLQDCTHAGRWPGHSDGELELELPEWAYTPDEEVTLTIGDEKVRV